MEINDLIKKIKKKFLYRGNKKLKKQFIKRFIDSIKQKRRQRQEELMRAKWGGKPFGIFIKRYYFSYDECWPAFEELEDNEKERAYFLNSKGFHKGLVKKELNELMFLFKKGIKLYEEKHVEEKCNCF